MILILLPIIVFGSLAYFLFLNTVQEEVEKNNDLMLKTIHVNIEQKMEEVRQTMYQTSLAVNVDSNSPTQILDVSRTLNRIKGTQPFIDDVFVYYDDKNWIISESGLFYPDYFFDNVYKLDHYDLDEILHKFQVRNDFQNPETLKLSNASGGDNRYLAVLLSFPLYNSGIEGTIVVLIDESKLYSIFDSMNPSDNESQTGFYILNDRLQTIIESDPDRFNPFLTEGQIRQFLNETEGDGISNTIQHNNLFVSKFHSKVMGWKYVAFSSVNHIFQPVIFLRNLLIVTSVFLLCLGVMLSVFLAKNLSKPIVEIVKLFQFDMSADGKKTKKVSELELISSHLHYITERNQRLMQNETEHLSLMNDFYAKTMILGIPEERMKDRMVPAAGFNHPSFSVIVAMIQMTDPSNNTFQRMNLNGSMIEVFNQTLNEEGKIRCIVTNIGRNQISILANYEKEDDLAVKLHAAIDKIAELPDHSLGFIVLGVGRPCYELMNVNRSYEEALEALNYRQTDTNIQLIRHEDIPFFKRFVDYPIDLEQQIIGSVLSGDDVNTEKLLSEMINRNSPANTYKLLKDLYSMLMATANKIIQRSGIHKEEVFDEAVISIYMNKEITSLESMKDLVHGIYKYMIQTLYAKKESKNDTLKEQLIRYIGDHYHQDLSLTIVADHFHLHPKYLSRYFKDQTGVNFVQYVNYLRIEHAKKLLLAEKNLTIDEVGERIGYISKNTFIATFKKQEGLTPGKYRDVSSS